MDLFFLLAYISFSLVVFIEHYFSVLYFVQSSGYTYSSIWRLFWKGLKDSYALWLLYFIIFVTLLILNIGNMYLLLAILGVSGILLSLLGDKFVGLKRLKYTKRVVRILVVSAILMLGYITFTIFVYNNLIKVSMLPMLLPLNFVILQITLIVLFPLEKWINKFYENKAKLKLNENKNWDYWELWKD